MESKLHFDTDYMRGAHPEIMKLLVDTNLMQTPGYGTDRFTARAKELIREACNQPEAEVIFLVGGTQTNSFVIDGILKHHEGVLAATTGHINVHEAGAIEVTGHKVLTLPSHQGKLKAEDIDNYITAFYADDSHEHCVAPGMVYISYPTEEGTLYSLEELKEISRVCHDKGIPLFLDGARLGYGLAAQNEVTLQHIAQLCDVFYIGGTKVGALFGEAVVMKNPRLIPHVVPLVKQHGALLAKGRLLGLQFMALFSDNLYLKISRNAIDTAMRLKEGFLSKGIRLMVDSPTNQQFFIMSNSSIEKLSQVATFEMWGPKGEEFSTVRFVTDWGTSMDDVEMLIESL